VEKPVVPLRSFDRLVSLVKTLRSEHGCPWDKAQTPEKIKVYLIEEAYEVLDAMESGADEDVCSELGDLLFHIVFLARLYEEVGTFNIDDVVDGIIEKMTRRHPHVFGNTRVSNIEQVKERWQEIKAKEALEKDLEETISVLDTVPSNLPALMRAYRIGERAYREGLDQLENSDIIGQVDKTLQELKAVQEKVQGESVAKEYGYLLFSMVNLGRWLQVHPETALANATSNFVSRFKHLEEELRKQGNTMESASVEELEKSWEKTNF